MVMEEKRINKLLYKLELYSNKVFPVIIAGLYFANTILSYFGLDMALFSWIGGISIITVTKFYISSYTYRFCEYHRIPLHYIVINNIITAYDYYIGIPISSRTLVTIHCCIAFLAICITLYLKQKLCKKL